MKVGILVVLIILPMLASIGLYCYSIASSKWSSIDEELIRHYSQEKGRERLTSIMNSNENIEFGLEKIRHAFRSRYSLFGYCLDYKWLNLLTVKPHQQRSRSFSTLSCEKCNQTIRKCAETDCCMKRCDDIPDCPTYIDEKNCPYPLNRTRYYWERANCIWHSTWIGSQDLPRYLSLYEHSPRDFHYYLKRIRHYVMFLLFVAAPLFTFLAFLIMFCINCVKRFYSIPFAFVSLFSLASFLCGAGALGIFLYEWIQERLHRPDFAYEFGHEEALVVALNPWVIEAERLGLAFWLTVAAISTTLFTTILSFCFCCGLQSEKSKLRFNVTNDVYEIVQMTPYEQ